MGVVLLVRHGQASFGSDDYDVLSETGWAQGRLLGQWLAEAGVIPDLVIRGSMRRHRETAEAVLETSNWTVPVQVDAGWDEFDHLGVIAADSEQAVVDLDRRAFQQVFDRATARWTAGEGDFAESYADFLARVRTASARAAEQAGPGRTVVVVSSGGPIGAVCADLVDGEADLAATARMWRRFNAVTVNSSVSRVLAGSSGGRLLTFNEHAHLDDTHLTYR